LVGKMTIRVKGSERLMSDLTVRPAKEQKQILRARAALGLGRAKARPYNGYRGQKRRATYSRIMCFQ
jgi:hypothetical protein